MNALGFGDRGSGAPSASDGQVNGSLIIRRLPGCRATLKSPPEWRDSDSGRAARRGCVFPTWEHVQIKLSEKATINSTWLGCHRSKRAP